MPSCTSPPARPCSCQPSRGGDRARVAVRSACAAFAPRRSAKPARSRRPDPVYPGDTARSRLIGAPDAHERDLGAAHCRAKGPRARFSWRGRRGGRLRGRAERLREPTGSRPSGSTTPPPGARRARRRGQRTPVAPAPIPVRDDTDVPARPRPGNQDVHLPRAGRRHSSQPADRPARRPRVRRRAPPAPGRRRGLEPAKPAPPVSLLPAARGLRHLHAARGVVPDAAGDLALPPRQARRPGRAGPVRLHRRRSAAPTLNPAVLSRRSRPRLRVPETAARIRGRAHVRPAGNGRADRIVPRPGQYAHQPGRQGAA